MASALPPDAAEYIKKGDPEALYEILIEVGQGSFGAVYKARDKQTGQAVAIKQMKRTSDDEWNDILKEIRFIRSLEHENVVKHLASYVKAGTIWMVMEFCIGSAADMIDLFRKPFAENEIAAVMHSIIPALAYLHERNRIHRDMKAANILLNSRGQVKLGDFGSAATSDPANTFVGTPCWMAPEVILAMESGLYTSRADIWSVGITAIEMAEKRPPLFEMNTMSALYHIPQNDPPTLTNPSAWSATFNDFLRVCLKKAPEERPRAAELAGHPFVAGIDPRVHAKVLKSRVRRCKDAAADRDADHVRRVSEIAEMEPPPSHPRGRSDGDMTESNGSHGRSGSSGDDSRRRRFSAMFSEDEEDLSKAMNEFHLKDETAEEKAGRPDGSPKTLRHETESNIDKQREKELVRAQLQALKYLQARQQKQLKQLEKTHEQQVAEQRRLAEKEAEAEAKLHHAEAEKLAARQKAQLAEHTKRQAQELKAFQKQQEADGKARRKEHEATLKRQVKDMEKSQKAEKEAATKDQQGALKDRFKRDMTALKTDSEAQFKESIARHLATELYAFQRQQQEQHHAFEEKQLAEAEQVATAQCEARQTRRVTQHEREAALALAQRQERHRVLRTHQSDVHTTEMEQLDLQLKKEEKDLRKQHQADIKAQPKQIKTIRSSIQRELTDTVKVTKQRHTLMQKQLMGSTPNKEEKRRALEQQRIEFEREMVKTNSEYERKMIETVERQTNDLETHHLEDEELLRERQAKDREMMADMQRLRRQALESGQAKELANLEQAKRDARDALATTSKDELNHIRETWTTKRTEMTARHTADREKLAAAAPA